VCAIVTVRTLLTKTIHPRRWRSGAIFLKFIGENGVRIRFSQFVMLGRVLGLGDHTTGISRTWRIAKAASFTNSQQLLLDVAANVEILQIKEASLRLGGDTGVYNTDDAERVLIETFRNNTLLNRPQRGFYTDYIPNIQD
jgi:hypothetical protein